MLPRFFVPEAGRGAAERVVLPEDESVHATRVLRLTVGDAIRVFNGDGGEWLAEITHITRRQVTVALRDAVIAAAESRVRMTLAVAVLKGDKMDNVVRDAVMLGARSIQPLVTERTEMGIAAVVRSQRVDRWQRIAVSSCKQCGRAVVPGVAEPQTFRAWITAPPSHLRVILVEPGAARQTSDIHDVPVPEAVEIAVGPEGGWTGDELREALARNARLVTLGGLTLRADAVPVVALTAIRTVWRDL